MNQDDSEDFFRPPNDNAYEHQEVRTGPPLSYVAEKIRHSLEALHCLTREIQRRVPASLSSEVDSKGRPVSIQEEYLVPTACYGFRSALTAYLALHNMLALANEKDVVDRLLGYTSDDFKEWLDRIDREGSIHG